MIKIGMVTALLLMIPLTAWTQQSGESVTDDVRIAVDKGNAAYISAYAAADAEALALVYDADGARLGSAGKVSQGRKAIAASVAGFLERVGPVTVTLETAAIWLVGETAYESGKWSYTFTPANQETRTIGGRYVTVWKKQADGGWKILADLGVPGTSL